MTAATTLARPLRLRVRLVIVDDHAIVRHGLRSILEREHDLEVVGEAADGPAALAVIAAEAPDVVLLDLRLDDHAEASGLDLCEAIAGAHPRTGIIVLTTFLEERLVTESIRRGAKGYVLKDVDVIDLVKIIRTVHRGGSAFDPRSAATLVRSLSRDSAARAERLTARELEVVGLIGRGQSNRRIGSLLSISESTVKFHVRNLMRKLGASTRAEVVYEASKLELL